MENTKEVKQEVNKENTEEKKSKTITVSIIEQGTECFIYHDKGVVKGKIDSVSLDSKDVKKITYRVSVRTKHSFFDSTTSLKMVDSSCIFETKEDCLKDFQERLDKL